MRFRGWSPCLMACVLGALLSIALAQKRPSTNVTLGRINGVFCDSPTPQVMKFLGIPYAKPPIGRRRFAAPQPWNSRYRARGLNATAYRPACIQPDDPDASVKNEDCLFLNIWTPSTSPNSNLPVRVFIHGGGYQTGAGSGPLYDGCQAAANSNAVLVTMNYRLGVLGYLALPGLNDSSAGGTTGTWGLLDQRMALRWVQNNIRAFGGDPAKVLLTGQSAGGYSTLLHTLMPGSRGLFAVAAPMSGSTDVMAFDFLQDAYAKGSYVASALNCDGLSDAALRECLLSKSSEEILAVQESLGKAAELFPAIDGVQIPDVPLRLLQQGRMARIPVLLGMNHNEGVLEATGATQANFYIGETDFLPALRTLVSVPAAFEQRVLQQYNDEINQSWFGALTQAITDAGYWCPAYRVARYTSAYPQSPTRFYIINAVQPMSSCVFRFAGGGDLGNRTMEAALFFDAFHGYDLPLQFLASERFSWLCPFTEGEKQLGSFLSGIITSSAASGVPMPPSSPTLTWPQLRNISWPAWGANPASQSILNLDVNAPTFRRATELMVPRCQIWDDILDYNINRGSSYDQ